ncbi:MAG: A24 family peptidase [Alphaproteobacteria bacterium]
MTGQELLQYLPVLPWFAAVGGGAVIGSFLNVVIHRLPMLDVDDADGWERPSLWWPPSHCPRCGAAIRPWHNVPILSYVALKGRCADCRAAISLRYPLVEAAGVLAAVVALWRLGPTGPALLAAALLWALVCVTAIDIEHMIIPDSLNGAILWTGLGASALGWWPLPVTESVLGAAVGYIGLRLLAEAAQRLMGREAMGGGDPKLLAALGAWVGWTSVPSLFFAACAIGTVVALALMALGRHHRHVPIPFGPFLAIAGGVWALTAGDWVLPTLPWIFPLR